MYRITNIFVNHSVLLFSLTTILLLSSCGNFQKLEFSDVKLEELSPKEDKKVEIQLSVKINNPNSCGIKINKAIIDCYMKDKQIGTLKNIDTIKLKSRTEERYSIKFELDLSYIYGDNKFFVKTLISKRLKIRFDGKAKARACLIPVNQDFELTKSISFRKMLKDLKLN